MAAKLVFAALSFLLVTSFLALPCLQDGGDLFASAAPFEVPAALAAAPPRGQVSMAGLFTSAPTMSKPFVLALHQPASCLGALSCERAAASYAPLAPRPAAASLTPSATELSEPPLVPASAPSCGATFKIFKPQARLFEAFEVPLADNLARTVIAALTIVFGFAAALPIASRAAARPHPGWRRLRSLPFGTEAPLHLSYFAPQRDA